jgi:hypothetical protein
MRARLVFTAALAATISFSAAHAIDCPGDVNGDGVTNNVDFLQLLAEWDCTDCASDINGDGIVNNVDFLLLLGDWGCEVGSGDVTLSGTVTNLWTAGAVAGASVQVGTDTLVTDEFGDYSGLFPAGNYDVVFDAEYYISQNTNIDLVEGVPATLDAQLEPIAAVVVNVIVNDEGDPGGLVDAMAEVVVLDGSTIQTYAWTQTSGAPAAISGADTDTATLTLGTQYEYKEQLFHILAEPPLEEAQLPPYVHPHEGPFVGGLQNRFEIAAPNPHALEETGLVGLMVDVTTTSGLYAGEGEVHTHIPWRVAAGIRNVPINVPVLLHGKDQASYDWTLDVPAQSAATLIDPTTQYPEFTPDWPGLYEVTVTDLDAGASVVTLQIYAGHWRGVIVDQDVDGRPIADPSCSGCHVNLGADKFTPWEDTGHAEIFTNNLNTSGYYNTGCFPCHSVGYDLDAANNGFDDSNDYQGFLAGGLLGNPDPDNWTNMLDLYPDTAQLANIQCENCHGPQWGLQGVITAAHSQNDPRINLSSDACGICHGEPLRHARYQQWQLSGHANYELAIDEGDSGSCSRCHTGNGFLAWLPVLLGDEPGSPEDSVDVTWTLDEVHPQTCVTCHDPHAIGTESGDPNNATVRISGDTPMLLSGFVATNVGRGAMCMTCHNARRGLRNEDTFGDYYGTSEAARAPHGPPQADIFMVQNAYLVTYGIPGNHSTVEDSCTNCHMRQTPPPDGLAYNGGGTNHTFFASTEICGGCHGPSINADAIQGTTHILLDNLEELVEEGLYDLIAEQTGLGRVIDLNGDRLITDPSEIVEIQFGEYRGRQSMTLTFTDPVTLGPYRLTDVDVLQPDDPNPPIILGQLYDFADPNLIKAGWNYGLVHNDGSGGIHNPSFVFGALVAGIEALDPPAAAAYERPWWLDASSVRRSDLRAAKRGRVSGMPDR